MNFEGDLFKGKLFSGELFSRKPLVSAMDRSGVTRLWMYELYAKSIEEDHKKRGLIKEEKEEKEQTTTPAVPIKTAKKVKTKRTRRPSVRLEQTSPYPKLPRYAPVFKNTYENDSILQEIYKILDEVNESPFNRLKPIKPKEVKIEKEEIDPIVIAYDEFVRVNTEKEKILKKKRKNNKTMLLLLAA